MAVTVYKRTALTGGAVAYDWMVISGPGTTVTDGGA